MMIARTQARLGWTTIVGSIALLAASAWVMQARLSHRPELKERPIVWFNDPVREPAFTFRGEHCEVRTIDPTSDTPSHLEVTWRGRTINFDIGGRDDTRLPGLLRHDDWFKVLPMAEQRTGSQDELIDHLVKGEVEPRLILAARYPAEGFNPESWGLVRRRDWRYRFVELKADGPVDDCVQEWSTTYREIERVFAPGPRDKPVDGLSEDDKRSRMWQYYAMLQVTPAPLYRAKDKVVEGGMRAMGWTWPAAGVATLTLIVGVFMVSAARVGQTAAAEHEVDDSRKP